MSIYIDDLGHILHLPSAPQRIISMVPSITLTLFDLGIGSRLVGRTKFCVEPSDAVTEVPIIGGTKKADIDKIKSLEPDLILLNKEENTPEMYTQLSGIAPVWVSVVANLTDNDRLLEQLGEICRCGSEATHIRRKTLTAFCQLQALELPIPVLYLIWKSPWMSIGADTFIHHILEKAGFRNVFQNQYRYPEFDPGQFTGEPPEIIFLSSEPYPFQEQHISEIQSHFPSANIMLVRGEYFSWHGSMMMHTPSYLQELLGNIK